MTHTTRESTFAIAVLALGTLGLCVALALDLIAGASGAAAIPQPTPTRPVEIQIGATLDQIRPDRAIPNPQCDSTVSSSTVPSFLTHPDERAISVVRRTITPLLLATTPLTADPVHLRVLTTE